MAIGYTPTLFVKSQGAVSKTEKGRIEAAEGRKKSRVETYTVAGQSKIPFEWDIEEEL